MPVRFLSDAELARLSGWPSEIADDDLITFFTLTDDDLGWLGSNYRTENRLGAAVQLCTLPWLGWIPDELSECPSAAVDRLADGLGVDVGECAALLSSYGGWEGRTRRDHRVQVLERLGWRVSATGDRKLLDEFLLARALEHDAPGVLLQLACDWLRSERVLRPPVDTLSRRVAAARDSARAETYHRLAPLLQPPRPTELDGLLDVDTELGMTRLAWMRRDATAATPEVLKAELAKLEFLRRHCASPGPVRPARGPQTDAGRDRAPGHQPGAATRRRRPAAPDPARHTRRDLDAADEPPVLPMPLRRQRRTPPARTAATEQGRKACTRCAATCSSPTRATSASGTSTTRWTNPSA